MQVPLFWITVFVNILQLFFSIYIYIYIYIYFSNLNMVIWSSNYCFCLYTEEPRLTTTSVLRIWRKFVPSKRVTRLSELSWNRQRFTHFLTKHGEPFKLQKVGKARRMTHFVQSPFCNGRVSLLAGPRFSVGTLRSFHWTKIPVWNFGKTTCPVEGTFQLQRPNQSHREFGYRACKQDTDHWSWGK